MMPQWTVTRAGLVSLAVASGVIAVVKFAVHALAWKSVFADFTVFWTAATFPKVYDPEALTRAQLWLLPPNPGLRPFPYPPSALPLMKPLGWLAYTPAAMLWTALGIICFAAMTTLYGRRALLAVLAPMFGLTVIIGQTSLFLGAALAAGVAVVERRPFAAGALLGAVAAVKPQLAVLVPAALLCGRHWRALVAAVLTGCILVLASLPLGPRLWLDWFGTLSGFQHQVLSEDFRAMNMAAGPAFAPLGILSVGYVWLRTARAELRLLAVAAGTCLCVPYLGNYDLVAMAPAAGVLLLGRDWRGWVVGLPAFLVLWFSPFVVAIGAIILAYRSADPKGTEMRVAKLSAAEAK